VTSRALLSGTGSLYLWNASLNRRHGGWTLVKTGVAYKATANATTNVGTPAYVWFIGCILIWIVAFPMYLVDRSRPVLTAPVSPDAAFVCDRCQGEWTSSFVGRRVLTAAARLAL